MPTRAAELLPRSALDPAQSFQKILLPPELQAANGLLFLCLVGPRASNSASNFTSQCRDYL